MVRATAPLAAYLALLLSSSAAAQNRYQARIDTWVRQDGLHPPPRNAVLFVGDSHIRYWESLDHDFASYDVIRRGFGGARFAELIEFVQKIVLPYQPAAIVTDLGGNDVHFGRRSAAAVFDDYLEFVDLVRRGQEATMPPIPILHVGSIPTRDQWSWWPVDAELNARIAAHSEQHASLYYVDTATSFLATAPAPGQPPASDLFVPDGLHLSSEGYGIWADAIHRTLQEAAIGEKLPAVNSLHPLPGARLLIDFGPSNEEDGQHTVSPDANGNHWNNWHAVRASRTCCTDSILAGESMGNLLSTDGQQTGIDLIVTGEFLAAGKRDGGLSEPSPAVLGDFAIASATTDFFWAGTPAYYDNFQTGGLMLTGLDPTLRYNLRFFASHPSHVQDGWSTEYHVFGDGEPVVASLPTSAGVHEGGGSKRKHNKIAIAHGIQSDPFGQIFIDVTGSGSHPTYLGIMEVTAITSLGDCTGDLRLDNEDLACVNTVSARDMVLDQLHTLPGDLDGDGRVDFTDFLTLSRNFGRELPRYTDGNIDLHDGIEFSDFLLIATNYGKRWEAVSVPEPPSTRRLLVCLALALLGRCRQAGEWASSWVSASQRNDLHLHGCSS